MGQACMKSGQVYSGPKTFPKCSKCANPIVDPSTHQCIVLTRLEDIRPSLKPSDSNVSINPATFTQFYGVGYFQAPNQLFNIKTFTGPQRTLSAWTKQPTWFFPVAMRDMYPQAIKKRSFQQKLYWFRLNVQRLRVSWQAGAEKIKVDRSNILMSSKHQLDKINLRKQVKIQFSDETVDDAGGLLRQYMHLALKQVFSPQIGIFEKSDCKQLAYRFKWDQTLVDQYIMECLKVLGYIIGKALFERISINCYLDRTILRQIAGQAVHLQDVYSYDQNIYKSVKSMLTQIGASQVALNFCIYHQTPGTKNVIPIELIPDGQNITVKDQNKQEYVRLMIHHYCTLSCGKYIEVLRQHIYKVVPYALICVFQPIELQMILYGPSNIDINDWKSYTDYKGYKPNDKQVQWFWEFMQSQNQQKRRQFIHYVTGTSRIPILGFKYLQSNRNQIMRFTIERAEYDQGNPYPKSYTCFNRIHLPVYATKQQLCERLTHILQSQITHYGLD